MSVADVPSIPADEHVFVGLVAAIEDLENVSLATDLASVVDISCYLTPDGLSPALTENAISDPRLCSAQTFEKPGTFNFGLDLIYIDQTNSDASLPNLAKITLTPGTAQYLIVRRGLPYDTALEEGQVIDIWPITPGQYNKLPPEANSVLKIGQKQFVSGPVQQDVVIGA